MSYAIVILAGGQGKRMKSDIPKVMIKVGDKPMLEHILETCSNYPTVVVGNLKLRDYLLNHADN